MPENAMGTLIVDRVVHRPQDLGPSGMKLGALLKFAAAPLKDGIDRIDRQEWGNQYINISDLVVGNAAELALWSGGISFEVSAMNNLAK